MKKYERFSLVSLRLKACEENVKAV